MINPAHVRARHSGEGAKEYCTGSSVVHRIKAEMVRDYST